MTKDDIFSDEEREFFDRMEEEHLREVTRRMKESGYSEEEIAEMRKER